jgi:hypothetical protein
MIVQRWNVEMLGGGKLLYLLPPAPDQSVTFLKDERRESFNIVQRRR